MAEIYLTNEYASRMMSQTYTAGNFVPFADVKLAMFPGPRNAKLADLNRRMRKDRNAIMGKARANTKKLTGREIL